MYQRENSDQLRLEEFNVPFMGNLNPNNRWVKLAAIMPWEKIEEYYLNSVNSNIGRPSYSARIEFGAIYVKQSERLTDESVVTYIQENPYVQFFLGLKKFQETPLFDSSTMVHFRKRFPVEFIAKVNEYICIGKWPEEMRNVDRNDDGKGNDGDNQGSQGHSDGTAPKSEEMVEENPKTENNDNSESEPEKSEETEQKLEIETESEIKTENKGTLIMDATVALSNIKYPTDIDFLNKTREYNEKGIDLLCPHVKHEGHKFPYNRAQARKAYLNLSKSKRWTRNKVRKAIEKQSRYTELASQKVDEMKKEYSDWEKILPNWLLRPSGNFRNRLYSAA